MTDHNASGLNLHMTPDTQVSVCEVFAIDHLSEVVLVPHEQREETEETEEFNQVKEN